MGLSDSYQLPEKYSDAYHLIGDGLAVPVVSWLSQHILTPLLSPAQADDIFYHTQQDGPQMRLLESNSSSEAYSLR